MTEAYLMVVPDVDDISEGHTVILICSFLGTPPVTVRWLRDSDDLNPLKTTTTNINTTSYEFVVNKEHTDNYYCQAENRANSVESNKINLVGESDFCKPSWLSSFYPLNAIKEN